MASLVMEEQMWATAHQHGAIVCRTHARCHAPSLAPNPCSVQWQALCCPIFTQTSHTIWFIFFLFQWYRNNTVCLSKCKPIGIRIFHKYLWEVWEMGKILRHLFAFQYLPVVSSKVHCSLAIWNSSNQGINEWKAGSCFKTAIWVSSNSKWQEHMLLEGRISPGPRGIAVCWLLYFSLGSGKAVAVQLKPGN